MSEEVIGDNAANDNGGLVSFSDAFYVPRSMV